MARHTSIMVSKTLYQIGVITLVASIIWVGVGIYLSISQTTITEVDKVVLEPMVPSIDQETIKALSGRLKVETTMSIQTTTESATMVEGEPQ